MPDQESASRIGQLVEGAGPRVQVDLLLFVELADAVVKAADGKSRQLLPSMLIDFGERAIFCWPRGCPLRQVGENERFPRPQAIPAGSELRRLRRLADL